jgi:hypothetical protein
MALPELDKHYEMIRRDVERTRQERLQTKMAMRGFTEGKPTPDTPPAPVIDYAELDARTVQIVESYIEAALKSEREKLVETMSTVADFHQKTLAALDRMRGNIDKMFDTLQRATGDGAVSAMQRQRMHAH